MKNVYLTIACSVFVSWVAAASPTSGFRGIYNTAPATNWQNAFLSGNGQSGVMIWGEPLDEKTTFNSHKFILPVAEDFLPDMTPILESARDTMLDGNLLLGWTNYCAYASANGLRSGGQSLHTGFNMKIQHTTNGVVQNYSHICNYETGEVIVTRPLIIITTSGRVGC